MSKKEIYKTMTREELEVAIVCRDILLDEYKTRDRVDILYILSSIISISLIVATILLAYMITGIYAPIIYIVAGLIYYSYITMRIFNSVDKIKETIKKTL